MIMNKKLYIFSWLVLVSAAVFIGVCLYWLVYPYNPIVFKDIARVENKLVYGGGYLGYKVNYCKYTTVKPLITKQFIDGIIYNTPQIVGLDDMKGCKVVNVKMYVPRALMPGQYLVHTTYRYQVNPLRYIDVTLDTEKFTIATPSSLIINK